MTIEHKLSLQGYATGYEILQAGKVVSKHAYEQPVKNLVVNTGKDYFFANAVGFQPGVKYGAPLASATQYMGRGSGSTAAAAGNTGLEAEIGNRTVTYLAGDPYTGVRYNKETGTIYLRRTYDCEVESSNQNINEVGFFVSPTGGIMFSRIVLPATVTVLAGQQLRLTYELQVVIGPIASTSAAPTITGWTTTGDKKLQGHFPDTTTTFGSVANQFIYAWGVDGLVLSNDTQYMSGLLEPSGTGLSPSDVFQCASYGASTSYNGLYLIATGDNAFEAFGDQYLEPSVTPVGVAGFRSSSSKNSTGTFTSNVDTYVTGNYYRDTIVVMSPNFPGGADLNSSVGGIVSRGIKHIFNAGQSKLNTQRLTLTHRISLS